MSVFRDRLPNKESRERHDLLVGLGYTPSHYSGGHLVYKHPAQQSFHLACTPKRRGHSGKAFIAELKRRHPEHFPTYKASRPRRGFNAAEVRRRAEAERKARIAEAERQLAAKPTLNLSPENRFAREIERPTCPRCGYVWLSDLDPFGRLCPKCPDEEIVVPANWEAAA